MTLYEAWAARKRWVVYRGMLCKLSMPTGCRGRLLVVSAGCLRWGGLRRLKHAYCHLEPMTATCQPVEPNTREFRELMRNR